MKTLSDTDYDLVLKLLHVIKSGEINNTDLKTINLKRKGILLNKKLQRKKNK